jgi:uncharacterized protein YjbJ (UPF0337 family)
MKGYDIGNNTAVIKMASLHITGNIIDLKWFKHLKLDNGKPDSLGILLLGDIVYWYRPIEVRDEETGLVTGYRKKFAADKLQRSYGAFAEAYGYTKDQVKDALKRLEDAKVIDLDFRHPTVNGQKLGNVLYIGLNVDRLAEISLPLPPLNGIGSKEEIPHPPTFKDDTNTEITTETSTEITTEQLDALKSFGLEWMIASGKFDLQAAEKAIKEKQAETEAINAFEKSFGFGTLPWASNSIWTKFQKFVIKIFTADPSVFSDYVAWRKDKGKYQAFSNRKIRENPAAFMDTGYPEFEASKMYAKPGTTEDRSKYDQGQYSEFLS